VNTLSVRWDLDILARSSIIHRDDYKSDATLFTPFRREAIFCADGRMRRVPILSGNSFRGILRRIGEGLTAAILDYENALPVPAAHLLTNGGRLAKTSRTLSDEQERRLKELLPQVAIFGGAASGRILSGLLTVANVNPEIAELAHILDRTPATPLPTARNVLAQESFTHLNDHRTLADQPPSPDYEYKTSPLGRYEVETLRAGTRLQTFARLDYATPTQVAFFANVLAVFADSGHLGAHSTAGHGHITATINTKVLRGQLPTDDVDWAGELAANRDEALAALTALT
jgi:hypothetical protein